MDLEEGLPKAINLTVIDWSHVQELDYEQFPFKCIHCHGYGHFSRSCKNKIDEEDAKDKGEQWIQVQKTSTTKQGNISKGKRVEIGSSSNPTGLRQKENEAAMKEITTQNNFKVLSIPEEQEASILEEGEVPQYQDQIQEENKELDESNQGSPTDGHSPT